MPHVLAAQKIIVVQPSSASAEHVFSLLACTFIDQQDSSPEETSLILQFIESHIVLYFLSIIAVCSKHKNEMQKHQGIA